MMSRATLLIITLIGWAVAVPLSAKTEKPVDTDNIKISKKDCQFLTRHRPAADVAYKPGVDVRGRKVVPADLPTGKNKILNGDISIDLAVPLRYLFPGLQPRSLGRSSVELGRITVDVLSGKTLYNGKPLMGDAKQRLIAFCQKAKEKKTN